MKLLNLRIVTTQYPLAPVAVLEHPAAIGVMLANTAIEPLGGMEHKMEGRAERHPGNEEAVLVAIDVAIDNPGIPVEEPAQRKGGIVPHAVDNHLATFKGRHLAIGHIAKIPYARGGRDRYEIRPEDGARFGAALVRE